MIRSAPPARYLMRDIEESELYMRNNPLVLFVVALCVSCPGAGAETNERGDSTFERVEAMGDLFRTSMDTDSGVSGAGTISAFESVQAMDDLVSADSASKTDDLLVDKKAKEAFAGVRSALAQAKANHFFAYFVVLSFVCAFLLGAGIAAVAYVTAAPHCKFLDKRRQSTALAAVAGATLGVLLATGLSVPAHGKLTYLILGLLLCSMIAPVCCHCYFNIARRIQILKAAKTGMQLHPERMHVY